MHLLQHPPDTTYFVRRCEPGRITIVDRPLARSFLLTPEQVVEDWPVTDVAAMTPAHAELVLQLSPALVLLGSGERLRFPSQAVLAAFLTRGIGIETMDNAAAARTFNVLAAEGRRVVAAFILPATTTATPA